jgi:hypothetical protein
VNIATSAIALVADIRVDFFLRAGVMGAFGHPLHHLSKTRLLGGNTLLRDYDYLHSARRYFLWNLQAMIFPDIPLESVDSHDLRPSL